MPSKSFLSFGVALAALGLCGCPGSLDDPGRFSGDSAPNTNTETGPGPVTVCDAPTVVFTQSTGGCVAGCHTKTAGPAFGSLDLETTPIGSRLIDKPSAGQASAKLIDKANPEQSALYTKLLPSPPFGAGMPLGPPLDQEKIDCVLSWIKGEIAKGGGEEPTDAGAETPADAADQTATDAADDT
jgi:hypothetical protein